MADVHKDIRLLKQNKSQKSQNPKGKGDIPFRTQTTHRRSRSLKSLCNTCHKLAACKDHAPITGPWRDSMKQEDRKIASIHARSSFYCLWNSQVWTAPLAKWQFAHARTASQQLQHTECTALCPLEPHFRQKVILMSTSAFYYNWQGLFRRAGLFLALSPLRDTEQKGTTSSSKRLSCKGGSQRLGEPFGRAPLRECPVLSLSPSISHSPFSDTE